MRCKYCTWGGQTFSVNQPLTVSKFRAGGSYFRLVACQHSTHTADTENSWVIDRSKELPPHMSKKLECCTFKRESQKFHFFLPTDQYGHIPVIPMALEYANFIVIPCFVSCSVSCVFFTFIECCHSTTNSRDRLTSEMQPGPPLDYWRALCDWLKVVKPSATTKCHSKSCLTL